MMMMMIEDPPGANPTVQIPPWDCSPDLTAHINSLHRYLPSNQDDVVVDAAGDGDDDSDDFDVPVDAYSCDDFRMFEFKVKKCARARSHDWTECPFAHPGEKARRRDPRKYHYSGSACPDFRKGACRRGEGCEYAHGVFECWLHPARYRTQPCKDGTHCRRRVCFFAHTPEQLRVLPYTAAGSPDAGHDPTLALFGSSPRSSFYSPPSSPAATNSPPVSPGDSPSLSRLTESLRELQLSKMKMGMGLSPGGLGLGLGLRSPRGPSTGRPGFMSLPSTPVRSVNRSGLNPFDAWEVSFCEEEPAMERVESGRALRERIYAKLGRENSLDRVGRSDTPGSAAAQAPDFGWVSELVK
ncbi:zinc finger CCCH domain-containing protein 20-like [Andrographis paniculata]|uniref:zinc finger CCCH domain-containing protein 20-like n=1 Tax=Andrographis paniculata TaxID=175694 RepID=UPI0021E6F320|nr:zinc finger CCCH domain-containing protein 20-like [Andrographis paniculata]